MRSLFLSMAAALIALPILLAAAMPEPQAVGSGINYIRATQQADGGFGGFGAWQTLDAVFALRAAGIDPKSVTTAGKSPADFLAAAVRQPMNAPEAAKAALAAKAMGLDPGAVAGVDLIAKVRAGLDGATGIYAPGDAFSQSVAILGQVCTGAGGLPAATTAALKGMQLPDGGWGFGGASDPDTTAIAVQALVAAGVPKADASLAKALDQIKATQGQDGGWGFDPTASNASSTAYVLQALIALGETAESAAYTKSGSNPVTFLLSQQQADGSFAGFDPGYATNQVVPALAGRSFCNAPSTALSAATPTATPSATATATPSATAPATRTPSAAATAAPRPPSTGTGAQPREAAPPAGPVVAGLVALVTGAALLSRRAR